MEPTPKAERLSGTPGLAQRPERAFVLARIPYLNSAPFFRGLPLGAGYDLVDCVPRELGLRAAAGEIMAGLLPLIDFFRLD